MEVFPPLNFLLGGIEKPLNTSYDLQTAHCNRTNKSLLDLSGMLSSQRDLLSPYFCTKNTVTAMRSVNDDQPITS